MLGLFRKDPRRPVIAALHQRIVTAARHADIYGPLQVPDSLEGRFEVLTLHVVLVLEVLRGLPAPADEVGQELVDEVFRQLEASLREMGVGDVVVPKRMKALAQAFYGRARAYDAALASGDETALAAALARNVYAGATPGDALARYVLSARRRLAGVTLEAMLRHGPDFPAPQHSPVAAVSEVSS
jgi:cytochrome b pre-mRNA-processing protein 3